jgi:hypothetical protein
VFINNLHRTVLCLLLGVDTVGSDKSLWKVGYNYGLIETR